jgi:hypothetical protein
VIIAILRDNRNAIAGYVRASIQDVEHDSEHPVFFNTIRSDDNETAMAG